MKINEIVISWLLESFCADPGLSVASVGNNWINIFHIIVKWTMLSSIPPPSPCHSYCSISIRGHSSDPNDL